jgi:hypothetical protein
VFSIFAKSDVQSAASDFAPSWNRMGSARCGNSEPEEGLRGRGQPPKLLGRSGHVLDLGQDEEVLGGGQKGAILPLALRSGALALRHHFHRPTQHQTGQATAPKGSRVILLVKRLFWSLN